MLCQHDQNRAIQYLLGQLDNVAMWGDILQMAVLELIRKVSFCRPFAMKCVHQHLEIHVKLASSDRS